MITYFQSSAYAKRPGMRVYYIDMYVHVGQCFLYLFTNIQMPVLRK